MWLTYLATDVAAASLVSGTEIVSVALGAINLGVAGWALWLFVNGKLHSDDEMAAVRKDLETTQAALERTRDALMLSSARNETGAITAEIIAQALGHGRHDRRDEDDDRRTERRDEDDDRRSRRRYEDDERRGTRYAEDDRILGHADARQLEGRHVPPTQD